MTREERVFHSQEVDRTAAEGEIFKALDTLEATYLENFKLVPAGDVAALQSLQTAFNCVAHVRRHLQVVIQDGEVAENEIKAMMAQKEELE